MKVLYCFLAIACLLVACSKEEKKESFSSSSHTTISGSTTSVITVTEDEKQAKAQVSITGHLQENMQVQLLKKISSNEYAIFEKKDFVGADVIFDVKKYIGQELFFWVIDKKTNRTIGKSSKVITEGNNAISIVLVKEKANQIYSAKITVLSKNVPQSGVKVYAIEPIGIHLFDNFVQAKMNLKNALDELIKQKTALEVTTDARGVATFENIQTLYSYENLKILFVVLKDKAPYYESLELKMEGTLQMGTISL